MRPLGLLLFALLLMGCGNEGPESSYFGADQAPPADAGGNGRNAAQAEAPAEGAPAAKDAAVAPEAAVERKIIYVADVALVVEDFATVQTRIPDLVRKFDGYLAQAVADRTQGAYPSGRWEARIPVPKFEDFLNAVAGLGVPERRTQSADDVTEEFVDLGARIANKKRLEERILELLEKREGKIDEVIEVERELGRVREEIERMEGRLRYLQSRTALTTVTITAREQHHYVPPQAPTFGNRIAQAWNGSLGALRQFGEWTAIALVACAPWIVPPLLIWAASLWLWRRTRRLPST